MGKVGIKVLKSQLVQSISKGQTIALSMYKAVRGFKTEEIVLLKKHPVRVYFKIKSLYLYPLGVISEQNRYNYTRKGCFRHGFRRVHSNKKEAA